MKQDREKVQRLSRLKNVYGLSREYPLSNGEAEGTIEILSIVEDIVYSGLKNLAGLTIRGSSYDTP